ncbi:hypothetical protein HID58_004749 [Brassica napus]|uniref:F-box domain-containing protein n=1 Tax=Brassica napus TaxID=3708 RepID=A0ABQ8E6M8_BRANA|nr:hypothetical protein HID58_004749 [Brassica napus]
MDGVSPKFVLPETFDGVKMEITGQLGMIWELVKAPVIVPLLQLAVYICLLMSIMLLCERVYMGIVIVLVKLFWKKPEKRYKFEPIHDDEELGSSNFPVVLVQIPMFNEREVYKLSIGAASGLSWPSDRLVIQVLDDSTDPTVKQMVETECQRWASKGINITYQIRENRVGYKAGALKEGLKRSYVKHCEYVVIFDADFQPEPDFLRRSIPFLVHNPNIALVQARWRFVNSDECLLTRMQEMSLDYHFTVEQEVGSSTHAFFGFNGTAGIWRIAAINEAGGWKDRTTVEDMDLAVRASLRGWKFLYLGDLQVKSELPSTFRAFRFQQHRWSCGPANLFRKMVMEIIRNKKVRFWKKVYVIYSFFFVRKVIAHWVTFCFYCVVLPLTILVPEVKVPIWGSVYIPSIITVLNSVGTPRSIHLLFYWILFENVMSLHRTKATLIGLFEAGRANEWVVTAKLGSGQGAKGNTKGLKKFPRIFKLPDRLNTLELGFAAFLFVCGCYDYAHGKNNYFIYLQCPFSSVGLGGSGLMSPVSIYRRMIQQRMYDEYRARYLRAREDTISKLPDPLSCPTSRQRMLSVLVFCPIGGKPFCLSVPNLDLDSSEFPDYDTFVTFIDELLAFSREENSLLYKVKLSLRKEDENDQYCVTRWIDSVANPKLNHLDVECVLVNRKFLEVVPQSLYIQCDTLVYLRLHRVSFGELKSVSLPCLKTMRDGFVDVFEREGTGVFIDAPRLKYLKFEDDLSDVKVITNSVSLEKVNVAFVFGENDFAHVIDLPKRNMVSNFFNSISGVKEMKISLYTMEFLDYNWVWESYDPLPQFCNVSTLKVTFSVLNLDMMMPTLLESFPNLKSLVLKLDDPSSEKAANIKRFNGGSVDMEVARYFLEKSQVLKKLFSRPDLMEERFSKQQRMYDESYIRAREDTISNLPDSLLCQILSYLPTKDTVGTSVLSHRWKSVWLLVPNLDLSSSEFRHYDTFVSFIDKLLAFSREENSLLYKVKLSLQKEDGNDQSCVTRWIDSVANPKLDHLDVECTLANRKFLEVIPQSLYVCDTLVYLRLHRVSLGELESVSLPCLKTMRLEHNVYASDASLELLISSPPALEDLSVSLTSFHVDYLLDSGVLIDAPRLKYLKFDDDLSDFKIITTNTVSLEKVNVAFVFGEHDFIDLVDLTKRNMVSGFFKSISGVKEMKISSYTMEFLDFNRQDELYDPLPQFCNVSTLKVAFYVSNLDMMLPTLLESFPNLKSLVLKLDYYDPSREEEAADVRLSSVVVPQCLLSSLESVKIKRFNRGPVYMEVARYFLENSQVLKKLVLEFRCLVVEDGFNMLRELIALPRRSSSCQVLLC